MENIAVRIGDVCIVKDEVLPRSRWPLVRVISARIGRDGRARRYTVRFPNGTLSERVPQILYLLEVL